MVINRLTSLEEIVSVMSLCGDAFYNQNLNNPDAITTLAEKFVMHGNVLVATEAKEQLGYIAYYNNDKSGQCAFVSMIIVRSGQQGNGVGTALLDAAKQDCIEKGMKQIRLEVDAGNNQAINFYLKKGFQKVSEEAGRSLFLYKNL